MASRYSRMPLVAVQPGSGMGNQLFMMAAALGYAERYGYEPVFWEEPQSSWEHKGSQFRVKEMFRLRVVTEAERQGSWTILREPAEACMSYIPPPRVSGNVKLEGYFQSDFYGPSTFPTPPSPPSLRAALIAQDWSKTVFLHVRRGDYLHPANRQHAVDLREYWCKAVSLLREDDALFVVSDDMAWCRKELVGIVGWKGEWLWCPEDLSDVETFFWMRACRGGICANSTFSWWAAWYLRRRVGNAGVFVMPKVWGCDTMPIAKDLHPVWANVLDV
jgi:hypothetical protein